MIPGVVVYSHFVRKKKNKQKNKKKPHKIAGKKTLLTSILNIFFSNDYW